MTVSYRHDMALISGALALILALVFGGMAWRQRMGRIIAMAVLFVFSAFGIAVAILTSF